MSAQALTVAKRLPPADKNGIRRVQVGCGPQNIYEDWWNVDIREFKGVDEVMDVTKPWPWQDRLDYVYGEHFLEHLEPLQAIVFLTEAARSLVDGGRIRLSTPSLEWVLATHFNPAETDPGRMFQQTIEINRAFHGWGHKFLYSKEALFRFLNGAGFIDIEFYAYGESKNPELRNLERHGNLQFSNDIPSVWIVEGKKKAGNSPDPALIETITQQFARHVASGH